MLTIVVDYYWGWSPFSHDFRKACLVKTRSTYKCTIDIGLDRKLPDVRGFDASAIEDTTPTGCFTVKHLLEPLADMGVRLLRLCWCCVPPGTNGPHWFVGDY